MLSKAKERAAAAAEATKGRVQKLRRGSGSEKDPEGSREGEQPSLSERVREKAARAASDASNPARLAGGLPRVQARRAGGLPRVQARRAGGLRRVSARVPDCCKRPEHRQRCGGV